MDATTPRSVLLCKPAPDRPDVPRPHLTPVEGQLPSPADLMFAAACRELTRTLSRPVTRSA